MTLKIFLALLALAEALSPNAARAHGVGWRQEAGSETVSLFFFYADQTPMAYSQVKIYSPAEASIEFQNARTDRNGNFAFRPDQPGLWKFETSDGQGHLVAGEVKISAGQSRPEAGSPPPAALASGGATGPNPKEIVLGLSLILNLGLLAALYKKGRKT